MLLFLISKTCNLTYWQINESYMFWSETCCQGCQKSCLLLLFFPLYEALEHPYKCLVQLQITVQRIFTASCLSFQTRKCHPSWQTHYSIINNAFHLPFFSLTVELRGKKRKNPCCFIFRFSHSSCHALWKTRETGGGQNAFHLVGRHLQPLDNNGPETTPRPRWSCLCSGNGVGPEASFAAATPSVPSLKESKQPAGAITWHISIQFPLQNVFIFRLMACHFAGAFGQELILESKQIFRGAIFHQVLIFLHSRSLYSLI